MFKKKNKNLHRALIALMVLGLLVCLCFTLASAATAEPDSSSAAETTAVEEQGAQSNTEAMTNFLNQAGIATLIHNADWKSIVMILSSFVLMYLAIGKGFEPLLLLPIAFGMLLTNLPGAGMFHSEIFEGGHIHWDLIKNGVTLSNGANEAAGLIDILYLGVKLGIYPCLIFIGVGAMTDFGPLIANPKSLLLGAAAQLGIFIAYLGALGLSKLGIPGLEFTQKMAASIGIIGGADGPTAIYVTSRLASELLGPIAIAAYSYMALVPVIQPPIMRGLTTKKERMIRMDALRTVSKKEKIVFPIAVTAFVALLVPSAAPLVGSLMLGNLFRECGVVDRLSKTAQNELMNIVVIFLGVSVGATAKAESFLSPMTLGILAMGIVAFMCGTAGCACLPEGRPARGSQQLPAHARHGPECRRCHRLRRRRGRVHRPVRLIRRYVRYGKEESAANYRNHPPRRAPVSGCHAYAYRGYAPCLRAPGQYGLLVAGVLGRCNV